MPGRFCLRRMIWRGITRGVACAPGRYWIGATSIVLYVSPVPLVAGVMTESIR